MVRREIHSSFISNLNCTVNRPVDQVLVDFESFGEVNLLTDRSGRPSFTTRRGIHSPLISHDNHNVRRPVDQVLIDTESLREVNLLIDDYRKPTLIVTQLVIIKDLLLNVG